MARVRRLAAMVKLAWDLGGEMRALPPEGRQAFLESVREHPKVTEFNARHGSL